MLSSAGLSSRGDIRIISRAKGQRTESSTAASKHLLATGLQASTVLFARAQDGPWETACPRAARGHGHLSPQIPTAPAQRGQVTSRWISGAVDSTCSVGRGRPASCWARVRRRPCMHHFLPLHMPCFLLCPCLALFRLSCSLGLWHGEGRLPSSGGPVSGFHSDDSKQQARSCLSYEKKEKRSIQLTVYHLD